MRVKRYVVNALPEALPMIRSELGKDAVILNTKEIRIGGFMGMFTKKKMEVIAAIESGASSAQSQQQPPKAEFDIQAVMTAINESVQRSSTVVKERPPEPPAVVHTQAMQRINDDLLDEIRVIKQSLQQLSSYRPDKVLSPAVQALNDRLVEQEVDTELIQRLLAEIEERQALQPEPFSKRDMWSIAHDLLLDWLEPYSNETISENARIVHFVGPTGVGKTTTIAKLAAEQTIKYGKQVGFITSDTYRIAAVDQLRTYANILNIPMEVVFSQMDLPKSLKQLEDRELIYMDTAGRNFRNELHVSEVNSLLQASDTSETVLVLSLTGKTIDMMAVANHFVKYGVTKVLFTKMDETAVYGAILNLAMLYQLKPTFVARGQTVPDDIERFRAEEYVIYLLGAAGDE